MIVEITMEKTMRIAMEFDVAEEQLAQLENGENPFLKEMEQELESGDCEYDFTVNDEGGETIIDWGQVRISSL